MRRTPLGGLALALLLALVLAPAAPASPLLTLRPDGTTFARDDRTLPPATASLPPARARRAARARRRRAAPSARAAATKRTVRGELARMLAAGAIDQATHDAKREIYVDALGLRGKLSGARRAALGAVLRNLEDVAARGGLTVSRLPALFETVARNRQWWSEGPLLRNGARVSFSGSRLVWQFYAGEGLQIQWLGTFGKANGLWTGGYDASLRALLDEALALAAQRAGGIAWEYLFRFDGGRPPWVSGLAQGTALQAFSRAAVRLGEPRYFEAARAGLGIFREAPPSGVRVATPAGAHYLIYSFAPGLRVLNGFTQALNGLHDFAALANDAEGRALFAAGEAQLRDELVQYDTGGWSRYALGGRDADVSYHTLARDFLRNLCERLTQDAARAAAPPPAPASPTTGGTLVPGGATPPCPAPVPALDPAALLRRRRALDAVPHPAAGRAARVATRARRQAGGRSSCRSPSRRTSPCALRRGGKTVIVLGGQLGSGVRSLRWPSRRARPRATRSSCTRRTSPAAAARARRR